MALAKNGKSGIIKGDVDGYKTARREYYNDIDGNSETFDSWASSFSSYRRGAGNDISDTEDGRKKGYADGILVSEQERHSTGDQGRSDQNYKVDLKEVDELVAKLKKKFASEQGGDDHNTAASDGTTERFAVSQGGNSQTHTEPSPVRPCMVAKPAKIFTSGRKIMVTKVQSDLIGLLKACGLDMETTVAIVGLCKTDENRAKLIGWIIHRYDTKGEVTEQDIQKMGLVLTGERKSPSTTTLSKTEADTAP